MKILAVIPARAGSRAIPNKNIRDLGGHPLIYYSIKNALESDYITDVIVTTDSIEVRIIAEQMNAKCHWRNSELCKDSVTLDAVIYDAYENSTKDFDYVITMQPTSPTLEKETLDKAIRYTIENDYDTVISAINKPHLSWTKREERIVPNYTERLNRQYLPPCYMETGAFVISKSDVISKTSRIGNKVNVFEVSEREAIDIDNYDDLCLASEVLNKKSIAIYVNGNNIRGTGHIYRALELADIFYTKPDIYYDSNQTDVAIFGKTTHNLIPVNSIVELFQIIKEKQYSIVINDILSTSLDYMIGLRQVMPQNGKIINFEDDGEGANQADVVINALFDEENKGKIYSGAKYYIAPKLFLYYKPIEIQEKVKKVFICFGGADPQNYTDEMLSIISNNEKYKNVNFTIALGRAKQNVEELSKYNEYTNIEVLYDVKNMPELMGKCDVGITSRGRTAYELAVLGIPSIVLSQNEREEGHSFVSDENGYFYLGTNPSKHIIESTLDMYISMPIEDRKKLQDKLLEKDLRNGRARVSNLILGA